MKISYDKLFVDNNIPALLCWASKTSPPKEAAAISPYAYSG
jgi:hypothetical protein